MSEWRKLAKKPVADQYTGTVLAGVANNGLLWPTETKDQGPKTKTSARHLMCAPQSILLYSTLEYLQYRSFLLQLL
jgi:hypothetical protein